MILIKRLGPLKVVARNELWLFGVLKCLKKFDVSRDVLAAFQKTSESGTSLAEMGCRTLRCVGDPIGNYSPISVNRPQHMAKPYTRRMKI